jgi:hypothetical protein
VPRALAAAEQAPATTDDQIVVGVDPATDVTAYRAAVMNQWRPQPDVDIRITRTMHDTVVEIGDARFEDQVVYSRAAATTRELRNNDAYRKQLEREALLRLRREIERQVVAINRSFAGLAEAARHAAAHLQHFQRHFVEHVYNTRSQRGWEVQAENMVEHFQARAEVSRHRWREAAMTWNEWQRRYSNAYNNYTWITAGSSTTNSLYYDYARWAEYGGQWRRPPADYTQWQWQGTAVDYTTAMTGTTDTIFQLYQVPPNTTGGANVYYGSSAGPYTHEPLCDCAGAGTCAHCLQRERAKRRAFKKRRQREIAEKRGRKLLLSLLSEEQMRDYAKTRTFKIVAADGRTFHLRKNKTAELLNEHEQAVASYCIHLYGEQIGGEYVGYVPEDTTIAQILMLQTDPAEFERIANITKLTPRPPTPDLAAAARNGRRIDRLDDEAVRRRYERDVERELRAEGIENPREWVANLRAEVRERYVHGEDVHYEYDGHAQQEIVYEIIEEEIFEVDRHTEEALGQLRANAA